ncbi:hypothetical protein QYM36_004821, partial [Artemia franciscana]
VEDEIINKKPKQKLRIKEALICLEESINPTFKGKLMGIPLLEDEESNETISEEEIHQITNC